MDFDGNRAAALRLGLRSLALRQQKLRDPTRVGVYIGRLSDVRGFRQIRDAPSDPDPGARRPLRGGLRRGENETRGENENQSGQLHGAPITPTAAPIITSARS